MTVKFNVKLSSEDMCQHIDHICAVRIVQGNGLFDRVDLSVICAFDAAHPLEATDSYVKCFEGCPAF